MHWDYLLVWIPDRRFAASGMTRECETRAVVFSDSVFKQPTLRRAGVLFFGRPAAPVSLFSVSLPKERDGAPGGAQGGLRNLPWPGLRNPATRQASGTQDRP